MNYEYDDPEQQFESEAEEISRYNEMYVIVIIADAKYAIPIRYVNEIVLLPAITPMPDTQPYIKGIINLRGLIVSVIDTRLRFALPTYDDLDQELFDILSHRKQEHINWLNALYASVDENTQFSLTTNPHECEFGKWYDNFKTDSLALSSHLAKFDTPHKRIHQIAIKVQQIQKTQGIEAAKEIIHEAQKQDLSLMISLFDSIKSVLKEARREVGIIMEVNGNFFALTADTSENIVLIEDHQIKKSKDSNDKFVDGIYSDDSDLILILNIERIVPEIHS